MQAPRKAIAALIAVAALPYPAGVVLHGTVAGIPFWLCLVVGFAGAVLWAWHALLRERPPQPFTDIRVKAPPPPIRGFRLAALVASLCALTLLTPALMRENIPWGLTACDRTPLSESLGRPLASIDPELYSRRLHHIEMAADDGSAITVIGVGHDACSLAMDASYLRQQILDHDVLLLERPTDLVPSGDFAPPSNDYFGAIALWAAPQRPVYYIDARSPDQLQVQRNHGLLGFFGLMALILMVGSHVGWRAIFCVALVTVLLGITSFPSPIERTLGSVGPTIDVEYPLLRLVDWSDAIDGFNIAVQDRLKAIHARPGTRTLVLMGDAHPPAMVLERTPFIRAKRAILDFIYGPEAPIARITAGPPGIIHMTPLAGPLTLPPEPETPAESADTRASFGGTPGRP